MDMIKFAAFATLAQAVTQKNPDAPADQISRRVSSLTRTIIDKFEETGTPSGIAEVGIVVHTLVGLATAHPEMPSRQLVDRAFTIAMELRSEFDRQYPEPEEGEYDEPPLRILRDDEY